MMEAFEKYEKYKDSGVEWIGEIPEHWEVYKVKNIFSMITQQASKNNNKELLSVYTDIGVKPRRELEERGNKASTTDNYWLVQKGDIIVNKLLAWMGAIGISDYDGVTSPAYDVLRAKKIANSLFYNYLFRNKIIRHQLKRHSKGIMDMRLRLYFDEFGQIRVPLPPLQEQTRIANFLDQKTQQIDTYIALKEKTIALLQERKAAIINQAVTKGLDPTVEMKDSGIEWLGEIPKGWEVLPMTKYFKSLVDYRGKTPIKSDKGIFLITAKNIKEGNINYEISQEYILKSEYPKVLQRGIPKKGDILFTTEAPLGQVAVLDREDIAIAQRIIKFRVKDQIIVPHYLKYWISSFSFQNNLKLYATGSTVLGIKSSKLHKLRLLLPPKIEQEVIINFINDKTQKIETAISNTQKEITLIKEYRQSLISSVVTGKVRV